VRHQELLGKGRTALVAEARMMAMFLCRELTRMTYQDIGTAFGNRNHATALHACRRIEELLRAEEKVRRDHQILLNTLRR
jgi:chromosomal replication initiator protein